MPAVSVTPSLPIEHDSIIVSGVSVADKLFTSVFIVLRTALLGRHLLPVAASH